MKDGRPLFASGPYDDDAKCRFVLKALVGHCGPGGYHYLLGPGM